MRIFRMIFALLLLFGGYVAGDVLVTTSPGTVLPGVTQNLNVRCSLTPTSTRDVNRVLVIQLEKVDGYEIRPVASITTGESAQLAGANFTVHGDISSTNPTSSYLELKVTDPDVDDTGTYMCVMSVLDKSYLLEKLQASASVNITDMESTDTAGALIGELRNLQRQVMALTQQIQSQTHVCPCAPGAASSGTQDMTNSTIAFAARPSAERPFEVNRLDYDTVDLNIGGAYDPVRSTFTAPVDGTYVMTASVSSQDGKTVSELKVNGDTKAQIATQGDDQSSLTLALDLAAGDLVWMEGIYSSHNGSLVFADKDTLFSGFLLQEH